MPHSSIAEQSKSLAPPLSLQQTFRRLLLFFTHFQSILVPDQYQRNVFGH